MRWTEYFSKINVDKIIFWIPDFQHKYFPELFSNENLNSIESNFKWIMRNGENVVFSSFDAMKDWDVFYPENKSTNHVVQFAVKHPEYQSISISSLREKFDIEGDYFMSPNQFWKHKNHSVIIEAVSELKKRNIKVAVLFSGKEVDNRNKEYVPSLKLKVKQLGLEKEIRFLGFLDRREQLKLMKESLAIIQPSKFEGWSTVIEDAMAIQKAVIASNLDVNIEQLGAKGIYFSPDSPVQLADILMNFNKNSSNVDYLYADKFSAYQNAVMEALL
jgi:glycosyltransferase involved in cell wall biosynthesis